MLWSGVATSLHQPAILVFTNSITSAYAPEPFWRVQRDSNSISQSSLGKTTTV